MTQVAASAGGSGLDPGAGLDGPRDRSRRPHVIPHEAKREVVGKMVYLRQHYHSRPPKISMYLNRYHDMQVSPSGVWRILKRLNMSRLLASQRYKRHRLLEALRGATTRLPSRSTSCSSSR